jgi:hypothetical protein
MAISPVQFFSDKQKPTAILLLAVGFLPVLNS